MRIPYHSWPSLVAFALILSGCPRRYAAWLTLGSTRTNLSIGVGETRNSESGIEVGLFAIAQCADHDATIRKPGMYSPERLKRLPWAIEFTSSPVVLTHVTYGRLPAGFRELSATAAPLSRGCYVAEVEGVNNGGSAYARFSIDSAGRASEIR